LLGSALPALGYEGRTFDQEINPDGARSVEFRQRFGNQTFEGTSGDKIQVEVRVRCAGDHSADCRHAAAKVRVDWERKGSRLVIRVVGTSRFSSRHIRLDTVVHLPTELPLEADTVSGDITVKDFQGDLNIDVAEGDVELHLKKKAVRRVNLDVGVGNAKIFLEDSEVDASGRFLDAVDWSNPEGRSIVEVDVGVGDAIVRLD
jgi:hypothetical protein